MESDNQGGNWLIKDYVEKWLCLYAGYGPHH